MSRGSQDCSKLCGFPIDPQVKPWTHILRVGKPLRSGWFRDYQDAGVHIYAQLKVWQRAHRRHEVTPLGIIKNLIHLRLQAR